MAGSSSLHPRSEYLHHCKYGIEEVHYCRLAQRQVFRQYLIGLLLPREQNKTLTVLSSLVPGSDRQRLHHFVHDAPWDCDAVNVVGAHRSQVKGLRE